MTANETTNRAVSFFRRFLNNLNLELLQLLVFKMLKTFTKFKKNCSQVGFLKKHWHAHVWKDPQKSLNYLI